MPLQSKKHRRALSVRAGADAEKRLRQADRVRLLAAFRPKARKSRMKAEIACFLPEKPLQ